MAGIEVSEALWTAQPANVGKLLYDPVQFATQWPGWERVEPSDGEPVTHAPSGSAAASRHRSRLDPSRARRRR